MRLLRWWSLSLGPDAELGEGVGSVDAVDIARGHGIGLGEMAGTFLVMAENVTYIEEGFNTNLCYSINL